MAVEYVDADGEHKRVSREVQPWPTKRTVHDMSGNAASLESAPVLFSQGELVETARSRFAQLDLIDRHLDISFESAAEKDALDKLSVNASELIRNQNKLDALKAELDHPETGLDATRTKHDSWKIRLKEPVLQEFPKWKAEQQFLHALRDGLNTIREEMSESLDAVDLDALDVAVPKDAPNAATLKTLDSLKRSIESALKGAKAALNKEIAARVKDIEGAAKVIKPKFDAQREKHEKLLASLGEADIKRANTQFQSLGVRLNTLEQKVAERSKLASRQESVYNQRVLLLDTLVGAREQRSKKRRAKALEYQSALTGIVEIEIQPFGDSAAYAEALRQISKGGRILDTDIAKLVGVPPAKLVSMIVADDPAEIEKRAMIGLEAAKRLVAACRDKREALFKLEVVERGDLPVMRYVIAPGRAKPLHELSTGQKGTVIIALALIEGPGPLIIDHPEEPLDTTSVYGQVVSKLRAGKETRQFIFTTHNANIAVGADAELSHILGASADKGMIETRGSVDDAETNRLLLLHLEGGMPALKRRVKKYRDPASDA